MRNYTHFDKYLDSLANDVYPQPPDNLQQEYGDEVIRDWIAPLEITNVLDVGCGQGQFANTFSKYHMLWQGVTLGTDFEICRNNGLNVFYGDFTFLDEIDDNSVDLVFARHSLEHSPFPVLTLMEWNRVSSHFLCVILPNPDGLLGTSHVGAYRGQNHYSVMTESHFEWLAMRAGWKVTRRFTNDFEMRFLLIKSEEITE